MQLYANDTQLSAQDALAVGMIQAVQATSHLARERALYHSNFAVGRDKLLDTAKLSSEVFFNLETSVQSDPPFSKSPSLEKVPACEKISKVTSLSTVSNKSSALSNKVKTASTFIASSEAIEETVTSVV